jgi:hypothetical protein
MFPGGVEDGIVPKWACFEIGLRFEIEFYVRCKICGEEIPEIRLREGLVRPDTLYRL